MNKYGFMMPFIEQLEELIGEWELNRRDFAWDGGELNSFLVEIEDLIDKVRGSEGSAK